MRPSPRGLISAAPHVSRSTGPCVSTRYARRPFPRVWTAVTQRGAPWGKAERREWEGQRAEGDQRWRGENKVQDSTATLHFRRFKQLPTPEKDTEWKKGNFSYWNYVGVWSGNSCGYKLGRCNLLYVFIAILIYCVLIHLKHIFIVIVLIIYYCLCWFNVCSNYKWNKEEVELDIANNQQLHNNFSISFYWN